MRHVVQTAAIVAPSSAPVLILGESGVGKELVATAHARISLLREKPLPNSPEVAAAIDHLLNLQEHDLEHAVWEQPTRMLLLLEGAA